MKRMSRDERIAAVMDGALNRAAEKRERERAERMKATGGLPFPALRARGSGSVATRSRRRTAGKHNAN